MADTAKADTAKENGDPRERFLLLLVRYFDNDRYEESGECVSLFAAAPVLSGRVLFLYSDILFERSVLERLLRAEADCAVVVDRAWVDQRDRLLPLSKPLDLVVTEQHHDVTRSRACFAGGVPGRVYLVAASALTSTGRTLERAVVVRIALGSGPD